MTARKILAAIIFYALAMQGVYLFGALVAWNFNPGEWMLLGRILFALWAFAILVLVINVVREKK